MAAVQLTLDSDGPQKPQQRASLADDQPRAAGAAAPSLAAPASGSTGGGIPSAKAAPHSSLTTPAPAGAQRVLQHAHELTLAQLLAEVSSGRLQLRDYLAALAQRSEQWAPELNCLINGLPPSAVFEAAEQAARGGLLAGAPFLVKDCIDVAGFVTTGGIAADMFDHVHPARDAPAVAALRAAGGLCVGKANLPDLHMGLSIDNSSFGRVKNPYKLSLNAIGSSGGVAAAVAAGLVPFGLGTDTGGCARIPAALCGVCGFRPSLERYSSSGMLNQSITRDSIGCITRSVQDIQIVDAVLATTGPRVATSDDAAGVTKAGKSGGAAVDKDHPLAATNNAELHAGGAQGEGHAQGSDASAGTGLMQRVKAAASKLLAPPAPAPRWPTSVAAAGFTAADLRGLRVGVPRKHYYEDLDPQVARAAEAFLHRLAAAGVQLVEADFPAGGAPWELDPKVGPPVRAYEVLREVSRYQYEHGSRRSVVDLVQGFRGSPLDKQMLVQQMSGDPAAGAVMPWQYRDALNQWRPQLQASFSNYFHANDVDAVVYPTTPLPARPLGQDMTVELNGRRLPSYATYTRNTAASANAGLPCLSLPVALSDDTDRVPVGMEIIAPAGFDERLLQIGRGIQQVLPPLPPPQMRP